MMVTMMIVFDRLTDASANAHMEVDLPVVLDIAALMTSTSSSPLHLDLTPCFCWLPALPTYVWVIVLGSYRSYRLPSAAEQSMKLVKIDLLIVFDVIALITSTSSSPVPLSPSRIDARFSWLLASVDSLLVSDASSRINQVSEVDPN
jgi:hypothetical protein